MHDASERRFDGVWPASGMPGRAGRATYRQFVVMQTDPVPPRLAAFYLPQFHPVPENDRFWGKGFTEWRNVVRARPLFAGHAQPQIPSDLGFYDLRLVETQIEQATLARSFGIGAFCYYHYWFEGRTILGRPLENVLAEPTVDLPFFLCWANEHWTRRWDGLQDRVLLEQQYSPEDDAAHIRALLPILADPRYERVDGRLIVLVYRARAIPNPSALADRWRTAVQTAGLGELHLCAVESFDTELGDPTDIGFDAAVEFQPDWRSFPPPKERTPLRRYAERRLGRRSPYLDNEIYLYDEVVACMMAKPRAAYARYPCVTPRWDNTPRRTTGAIVLRDATPSSYGRWLGWAMDEARDQRLPLVFVNAWNEWAEGAFLEPDLSWGRAYLEATREVVRARGGNAVPE